MQHTRFVAVLAVVGALLALFTGCKAEEEIKPLPTPQPAGPDVIVSNQQVPPEHTVEVTGYGEFIATPDYATITLSVQGSAEAVEAASAICETNKKSVLDVAVSLGVRRTDIKDAGATITPQQRESDGAILGYTASELIIITAHDVKTANTVVSGIIDASLCELKSVTYSLLDSSAAYREAMAEAMADALQKAEALAEAGGVTVGAVVSAVEIEREDSNLSGMAFESSAIAVPAAVRVQYLID